MTGPMRRRDGRPSSAISRENSGIRSRVIIGLGLVLLFFGVFGAWAALAPIDSAVIASGTVVVEGSRKTIQHLEGGIVSELLVQDGDRVEAGDVLVRLDVTRARAELDLFRNQLAAARAEKARMVAERDKANAITFPADLMKTAAEHRQRNDLLDAQQEIFNARRLFVASQNAIQQRRIARLREEIAGLKQQIVSQDRQLGLIADEIETVSNLLKKGITRRPRLLLLQRQGAKIEGERAGNVAMIARAQQSIAETELQLIDLDNRLRNEVVQGVHDTQKTIDDLNERVRAATDVLARTDIIAPVTGSVVGLRIFTRGGVVAPGAPLMDIVPTDGRLIIEARVQPTDIDLVHVGLKARVRLVAFNQRNTQPIEGVVERVSADTLQDERTGVDFYIARISLESKSDGLENIALQPGMPVEVMIVSGVRTTLEYLLEPITASLRRGIAQD